MSLKTVDDAAAQRVAIQVFVPAHFRDELIAAANDEDRSLSNYVRHVLRRHLAQQANAAE